jgi:esterase/lipase superfamily enzyme
VNSRPFKSFISLSCAFVLTACASTAAGIVVVAELESPPLAQRNVWVANFRSEDGESAAFGEDRPDALRFERHVVAIPPRYETGQIELPSANPDTDSQFVTRSIERFASSGELMDDIDATYGERVPELGLFVHGYNTSHAAAVYGFAQLLHEYDAPFPAVLFSWPSSAQPPLAVIPRGFSRVLAGWIRKVGFGREAVISHWSASASRRTTASPCPGRPT